MVSSNNDERENVDVDTTIEPDDSDFDIAFECRAETCTIDHEHDDSRLVTIRIRMMEANKWLDDEIFQHGITDSWYWRAGCLLTYSIRTEPKAPIEARSKLLEDLTGSHIPTEVLERGVKALQDSMRSKTYIRPMKTIREKCHEVYDEACSLYLYRLDEENRGYEDEMSDQDYSSDRDDTNNQDNWNDQELMGDRDEISNQDHQRRHEGETEGTETTDKWAEPEHVGGEDNEKC
ncbi:hypothetical protein MMC25_006698 [Agyrium rufum]|nr:hypothetical protein [Agyrium rufum]